MNSFANKVAFVFVVLMVLVFAIFAFVDNREIKASIFGIFDISSDSFNKISLPATKEHFNSKILAVNTLVDELSKNAKLLDDKSKIIQELTKYSMLFNMKNFYIVLEENGEVYDSHYIPSSKFRNYNKFYSPQNDLRNKAWFKTAKKTKKLIFASPQHLESGEYFVTIARSVFVKEKLVAIVATDVQVDNLDGSLDHDCNF